jgi:hypothetical protein
MRKTLIPTFVLVFPFSAVASTIPLGRINAIGCDSEERYWMWLATPIISCILIEWLVYIYFRTVKGALIGAIMTNIWTLLLVDLVMFPFVFIFLFPLFPIFYIIVSIAITYWYLKLAGYFYPVIPGKSDRSLSSVAAGVIASRGLFLLLWFFKDK